MGERKPREKEPREKDQQEATPIPRLKGQRVRGWYACATHPPPEIPSLDLLGLLDFPQYVSQPGCL